ncbi:MAG: tripartite ATP-independent transporter DctP family solute receptor [Pseudohongiellaceae bacterium]|jgi:tripartite ATP-independent transporter DctP family solute receptor
MKNKIHMLALSVAMVFSINTHAAKQLVVGHVLSETSHYGVGAEAFVKTLSEASNGEWTGRQAAAGSLGGERDMIEGLQIGSVDLVITSTGPLGNFVPEVYVLDLPFLFRDYDHARTTLDGNVGMELLNKMGDHDLVGLAWSENGFRHVTNSKREVKTPDDLQGLKLRTMQNKVHMAAFSGMGASPTPMAFPELFSALQQGVVDGQENPVTVISSSKFWEVQKYVSLTGHVYSPAIILASPSLWSNLSDEEKTWFEAASKASAAATRAEVNRLENDGIALLRSNGMTVSTDIDKGPFATLAKPSYAVFTDKYGTELVDKILAIK